jgi:hypothetical protein
LIRVTLAAISLWTRPIPAVARKADFLLALETLRLEGFGVVLVAGACVLVFLVDLGRAGWTS